VYATLGNAACGTFFRSIFFKSRSSGSFSANLNDFVGPLDFLNVPSLDYTVQADTLSCKKPLALLPVTARTTAGSYSWKPINGGHVAAANQDSSNLFVDKAGQYIVNGAVAAGCPVLRRDTIAVAEDLLKPVAAADIGADSYGQVQLYGGDTAASNKNTPFGKSKGLSWSWTGPNGFSSDLQNPYINNNWGAYDLTLTEKRNGCVSTATIFASFSVLPANRVNLTAARSASSVTLKWNHNNDSQLDYFEIEQKQADESYKKIGSTKAAPDQRSFEFADYTAPKGDAFYRIKCVAKSGITYYSNMVHVKENSIANRDIYLTGSVANRDMNLVLHSAAASKGKILVTNLNGVVLSSRSFQVNAGYSTIPVSLQPVAASTSLVTVYINNKLVFTDKIIGYR
jgi:hypothetical protein